MTGFELLKKQLYSIEFAVCDGKIGFEIETEADNEDEYPAANNDEKVRLFASKINNENEEIVKKGMRVGDEIVIINGSLVENLNVRQIESFLKNSKSLRLTMKTAR